MNRIVAALSVVACSLFSSARGEVSLWIEGKDRPEERVNVGVKSLAPDVYLKITEKVDRAVVNVSSTKVIKPSPDESRRRPPQTPNRKGQRPNSPLDPFFGDEFFEKFFSHPWEAPREEGRRQGSLGSGFILNSDGYIVTNNHVVDKADEVKVILSDETEYVAKIVGRDPKIDLALLKIEPKKKLVSVILGDSDQLKVGEVVVAIGNPFGLSHSVTQGIVSAKERSIGFGNYDDFIQTDASINPGNSGGPLLNLNGEVVGINTAIVASGQGIGFAIPVNLAKNILPKLKADGRVVRGWLGVFIQKVTEEHARALKLAQKGGALVSDVQKDSPAEKAGILSGDVIVKFNRQPIKEWRELPIRVAGTKVGTKVTVELIRDGQLKNISVEISELKDSVSEEGEEKPAEEVDQLGLTVEAITPEIARQLGMEGTPQGVLVTDVDQGKPAAEKGIRKGDVIVEVNRKKTASVPVYREIVGKLKKGDSVLLLVRRGEGSQFVAFTL